MDRREFLQETAWMGLAAAAAGCQFDKMFSSGGAPVEVPDFTRGAWKTMKPLGIVNVDVAEMGFGDIRDVGPQQTIGQGKEG